MAVANSLTPRFNGVEFNPYIVIADDATPAVAGQNVIPPLTKVVEVQGVTNDANDWIVLPSLASCPNGHEIHLPSDHRAGQRAQVRFSQ